MKLDNIQNPKIRSALLLVHIVWLSLWLNVVCEFDGPITIWSKWIQYLTSDELNFEELEAKDALLYMKRYIYADNSHIQQYPHKPLFLSQLYILLSELKIYKLTKYFPVDYRVKNKERTGELDYRRERLLYKLCHAIASRGDDIKDRYYEEYVCIANKYNWPFIVNSDDAEY